MSTKITTDAERRIIDDFVKEIDTKKNRAMYLNMM